MSMIVLSYLANCPVGGDSSRVCGLAVRRSDGQILAPRLAQALSAETGNEFRVSSWG